MSKRQDDQICFPWISSVGDSRAKTFPAWESAPDLREPDRDSGSSSSESSTSFPRSPSSSRTSPAESARGCPKCGMISCRLATARKLSALEQKTLEHPTADKGRLSSLWATPTAHGNTNKKTPGKKSGDGLRTQVGGSLSVHWVEALMGFPIGWTSPDDGHRPEGKARLLGSQKGRRSACRSKKAKEG